MPTLPGFFLISADAGTSCFVSDDRQCIYSDTDGAGAGTQYGNGNCEFGITLDNVITTTVGSFALDAGDQTRVSQAVEAQPAFEEPSIGPINVEADKDTTWILQSNGPASDSGWTICIQELDLTMHQATASTIQSGGEVATKELINAHNQNGLAQGYTSGTTVYQTYITGAIDHDIDDTTGFESTIVTGAVVDFDVGGGTGLALSHFAFWPEDGVEMDVLFSFSNDPCGVGSFNRSFVVTPMPFVVAGGTIDVQLIRIPNGVEGVQCVRMTMNNCNDLGGLGGSNINCSFSEIAFLSPDLTAAPVTPP